MNCIAYLAPEIPALSATFVYNEILALQDRGYEIVSISVHEPSAIVLENRVDALRAATHSLYRKGLADFILAALSLLCVMPRAFCRTIGMVLQDASIVGLHSRTRIGLLYRFFSACRVACILRQKKCSHIHAHFAHVPTDIAMYAASLAGIPFSFTAHANDLFERGWLLSEKIARSAFAATISEFNRDFMIAQGGERNKIHIVRCGIDSARFSPAPPRRISPPYLIGTIGRMVEKKGFDTLLHAAALLRNSEVDFHLVIAGGGSLELELRATSDRLGLTSSVEFPGPMANEQVPTWLQSLDLFVLPCQQDTNGDMDGIPVVLMEAMASGVPVVSTRISGVPELITHGYEGLLVEPRSAEALADAITQLLFNDELRASCSKNGRLKVVREFDAEVNIDRLVEMLSGQDLLNSLTE